MRYRTPAWLAALSLVALAHVASARPLAFEANRGQAPGDVRFFAARDAWIAELRDRELRVRSADGSGTPFDVAFHGAAPDVRPAGEGATQGPVHYFVGRDPAQWHRDVPRHEQVRWRETWRGIDALLHDDGSGALELDFAVRPGADVAAIELDVAAGGGVALEDGALLLREGAHTLRLAAPRVFQQVGGAQREVAGRFAWRGPSRVGFEVAPYDATRPLVIDPVVTWATPLGGADDDRAQAIAVDADGFVYVAGRTRSLAFPAAPVATSRPKPVVFVTKLAAGGSRIVWTAILGATTSAAPPDDVAIAVDLLGSVHVVGTTDATDFPVVNPVQPFLRGGSDAFVAKLAPDGAQLLYASYFGGSGDDRGRAVGLDFQGFASIGGSTASSDFFTSSTAPQRQLRGGSDGFVAKLTPDGTIAFSTYLGGAGGDSVEDLAVDGASQTIAVGSTRSADFPTTAGAFQTLRSGASDAFATALSPTGAAIAWSTLLGGAGDEAALGVALDRARAVYVTGFSNSAVWPTPGAIQPNAGGGGDAFVAKLAPGGAAIAYGTLLGGAGPDLGSDIAVDEAGRAHVTGLTGSPDFPHVRALQGPLGGTLDAFAARVVASGALLDFASPFGGSGIENPDAASGGIAVDVRGVAYLALATASADFPSVWPLQSTLAGGIDAGIAAIATAALVEMRLQALASGTRMTLRIASGASVQEALELKLWIDLGGARVGILAVPLTLSPNWGPIEITADLPALLVFPGTRIGARLIDRTSGASRSESVCSAVPCH